MICSRQIRRISSLLELVDPPASSLEPKLHTKAAMSTAAIRMAKTYKLFQLPAAVCVLKSNTKNSDKDLRGLLSSFCKLVLKTPKPRIPTLVKMLTNMLTMPLSRMPLGFLTRRKLPRYFIVQSSKHKVTSRSNQEARKDSSRRSCVNHV